MSAARILVTGGAGFIGSALVRDLIANTPHRVLVLDALTYAGTLASLASVAQDPRFAFQRCDIGDASAVGAAIAAFKPDAIVNLAAETHVDRSLDGPQRFIETNVSGTFALLQAALRYWRSCDIERAARFRFVHVSTDEVFGALGDTGRFTEASRYDPRSPYAASKAASDHLVRAWHHSYGLATIVTHGCNTYGPYQFPEKLIPLVILRALSGQDLPVYGDGRQVRDWLYVEDHARALRTVIERGRPGESYAIGGDGERENLAVVEAICAMLDEAAPTAHRHADAIRYVADRPGHDRRYAIDARKLREDLGWAPLEPFAHGIRKTVRWYLDRPDWWQPLRERATARQGLGAAA